MLLPIGRAGFASLLVHAARFELRTLPLALEDRDFIFEMQLLLVVTKDNFDELFTPGEQLQDCGRAFRFGNVRRSEILPHDRVRLCTPVCFAQPGDFLFQRLKPLMLAIDHVGQLLEYRQQFKLPWR